MKKRQCWSRNPQSISLMENQLKLTALPRGKFEVATALFSCRVCLSLSVCTSLMSRPAVCPLLKMSDCARMHNFEV